MNRPMYTYSTYPKWRSMINRCTNPNETSWHRYGGRGITVCKQWMKFENFYADMGDPPPGTTLERKKNHLGYSKGNCVWAIAKAQANNRRTNRNFTYRGETRNVRQWSEHLGLSYPMLYKRLVIEAWSVQRALLTPKRGSK